MVGKILIWVFAVLIGGGLVVTVFEKIGFWDVHFFGLSKIKFFIIAFFVWGTAYLLGRLFGIEIANPF